jgi:hypothetical protein
MPIMTPRVDHRMLRCAVFTFCTALLGAATAYGTHSWRVAEYALLATSLALVMTVMFLLLSLDGEQGRG